MFVSFVPDPSRCYYPPLSHLQVTLCSFRLFRVRVRVDAPLARAPATARAWLGVKAAGSQLLPLACTF